MSGFVRIAVKEPKKPWTFCDVVDVLDTYQKLVGGYIECFWSKNQISFFCNEDGKFMDLKYNFRFGNHDFIMGTVFAARIDRYGEFTSLTDDDYEFFKQLNEKGFDYALQ